MAMTRRGFLARLAALGAGLVVVGPAWLAEVQRNLPGPMYGTSIVDIQAELNALLHRIYQGPIVSFARPFPVITEIDRERKSFTTDVFFSVRPPNPTRRLS